MASRDLLVSAAVQRMIREADISDLAMAVRIHALQQAAYAVEAEHIGCADFLPLRETIEELQRAKDRFLVSETDEAILGALSFEQNGALVVVMRLVVSPECFRQGLATALLRDLAIRVSSSTVIRAVTAELNGPAICCYAKQGYRVARRSLSPEGIALVHLEKPAGES
jgi:ribosomal protein S18 acetylase RimI-like enzyme